MAMYSLNHSSSFYNSNNITPPITPLKQRIKKQLSPINVAAATAHFQDARTRSQSNSPVKEPHIVSQHTEWASLDADVDALETPPLSAASTSGEVSAPLDAMHPLFGNLTVNDEEVHGGGLRILGWGREHDLRLSRSSGGALTRTPASQHTASLAGSINPLDDSPRVPPPTPLLPSGAQFTPPRQTDLYHYSTTGDSLVFFDPDSEERHVTPRPDTLGSSPTTPKAKVKRSEGRRKGKGRSIGGAAGARRSPSRRTSPPRKSMAAPRRFSARFAPPAAPSSSRGGPSVDMDDVFSAPRAEVAGLRDVAMDDADDEHDSSEDRDGAAALQAPVTTRGVGSRRILLPAPAAGTRKPFGTTLGNTRNLRSCSARLNTSPEHHPRTNRSPSRSPSKGLGCLCGRTFSRQDAMHRHVRMSVCRGAGLGLGL